MARYIGQLVPNTGYAAAGRNYLMALWAAGLRSLGIIQPGPAVSLRTLPKRFHPLLELRRDAPDSPTILHWTVDALPQLMPQPGRKIGLSAWDTDNVPAIFIENLSDSLECLWVPCEHNKRVFTKSGFKKPIHIVPHALDPAFAATMPPAPTWKEDRYVFYTVGTNNRRKNPVAALRAYLLEFTAEDHVAFAWKTNRPGYIDADTGEMPRSARAVIGELLEKRAGGPKNAPLVWIFEGELDEAGLLALHGLGDCFVSSHRGEAWGYALHEAKACGRAVIASRYGGPLDFLDESVDTLVGGEVVSVCGMETVNWLDMSQNWFDPNEAELRQAMRRCYRERTKGSTAGLARFYWAEVGKQLRELIGA